MIRLTEYRYLNILLSIYFYLFISTYNAKYQCNHEAIFKLYIKRLIKKHASGIHLRTTYQMIINL